MVAATAVDCAAVGPFAAANLQVMLGQLQGQTQYAADAAGSAEYKADQAQAKADTLEGSVDYANQLAGFLEYHSRQMATLLSYTIPPFVYVP